MVHTLNKILYYSYLYSKPNDLFFRKNRSKSSNTFNKMLYLHHLKNLKNSFLLSEDKSNFTMRRLNANLLFSKNWLLYESFYQSLNNQYGQKYSDYITHLSIFHINTKLSHRELVDKLLESFKERTVLENRSNGIKTKTYPFISSQIIQKFENISFSNYIEYNYKILVMGISQSLMSKSKRLRKNIFESFILEQKKKYDNLINTLDSKYKHLNFKIFMIHEITSESYSMLKSFNTTLQRSLFSTAFDFDNLILFDKLLLYKFGIGHFSSFIQIVKQLGLKVWSKTTIIVDVEYSDLNTRCNWSNIPYLNSFNSYNQVTWLIDLKNFHLANSITKTLSLCRDHYVNKIAYPYKISKKSCQISQERSLFHYWLTYYFTSGYFKNIPKDCNSRVPSISWFSTFFDTELIISKITNQTDLKNLINLCESQNKTIFNLKKKFKTGKITSLALPLFFIKNLAVINLLSKKNYIIKLKLIKLFFIKTFGIEKNPKSKAQIEKNNKIVAEDKSIKIVNNLTKKLILESNTSNRFIFKKLENVVFSGFSKKAANTFTQMNTLFLVSFPLNEQSIFYFNYLNFNISTFNKSNLLKLGGLKLFKMTTLNAVLSVNKYQNYNWIKEFQQDITDDKAYTQSMHLREYEQPQWDLTLKGVKINLDAILVDKSLWEVPFDDYSFSSSMSWPECYFPLDFLQDRLINSVKNVNLFTNQKSLPFMDSIEYKKEKKICYLKQKNCYQSYFNIEFAKNIYFLNNSHPNLKIEKFNQIINELSYSDYDFNTSDKHTDILESFDELDEIEDYEFLIDSLLFDNDSMLNITREIDDSTDSDLDNPAPEEAFWLDDLTFVNQMKKYRSSKNDKTFYTFKSIELENIMCNPRELKYNLKSTYINNLTNLEYLCWKRENYIFKNMQQNNFDIDKIDIAKGETFNLDASLKNILAIGDKQNVETSFIDIADDEEYQEDFSLKGLEFIDGVIIHLNNRGFFNFPIEFNLTVDYNCGLSLDYTLSLFSSKRISRNICSGISTEFTKAVEYEGYFVCFAQTTMITPRSHFDCDLSTAFSLYNDGKKISNSFCIRYTENDSIFNYLFYNLELSRNLIMTKNRIHENFLSGNFNTGMVLVPSVSNLELDISFDKRSDPYLHADFSIKLDVGSPFLKKIGFLLIIADDTFEFHCQRNIYKGIFVPFLLTMDIMHYFLNEDYVLYHNTITDEKNDLENLMLFKPTAYDYFFHEDFVEGFSKIYNSFEKADEYDYMNFKSNMNSPVGSFYDYDTPLEELYLEEPDFKEKYVQKKIVQGSQTNLFSFQKYYEKTFQNSFQGPDGANTCHITELESNSEIKFRLLMKRNKHETFFSLIKKLINDIIRIK